MESHHRNSGFSHEKWWFSIVMLNYQRVNHHCPVHQCTSFISFVWYATTCLAVFFSRWRPAPCNLVYHEATGFTDVMDGWMGLELQIPWNHGVIHGFAGGNREICQDVFGFTMSYWIMIRRSGFGPLQMPRGLMGFDSALWQLATQLLTNLDSKKHKQLFELNCL